MAPTLKNKPMPVYNCQLQIDQDDDYRRLYPVFGDLVPTVEANYSIDSDGMLELEEAIIHLGGREVDLNTKDDKIKEWVKHGCKLHYAVTLKPVPVK
jgi:hypothetical protein